MNPLWFPPPGLTAEDLANLILHVPHAHLFKEPPVLSLPDIPPSLKEGEGADPVDETTPRDIPADEEPDTLDPLGLDSTIHNGIDRGLGQQGSYTTAEFAVDHDSRKRPGSPLSMEARVVSDIQASEGRIAEPQRKHRRIENAAISQHEAAHPTGAIPETLPDTIQPIWPAGEALNGFQQRLRELYQEDPQHFHGLIRVRWENHKDRIISMRAEEYDSWIN
ncbi:hypothetical protein CDV31_004525 [Fusarium ambrosium]|uniref:Uncharacterized protein n=1 Tax=Fusarium ambrosium TaxID=131363 RepID=A0A428UPL7_9HYPO|nr:hypothetical protein CDV31_004525 [Fusarium ambrosium]